MYVSLKHRITVGMVWDASPDPPEGALKSILASTGAVLPPWVFETLRNLSRETGEPPGTFLRFALPPGVEDLHRIQIRPLRVPLSVPGVRRKLLQALGTRRWRSWKRLRTETGATSRDLLRLLEAGAVEIREHFPRLAQTGGVISRASTSSVKVLYGLSLQEKRRLIQESARKRPVMLWAPDPILAELWGNLLRWPVYSSLTPAARRRRIWREALEGRLQGVVVTHAGFLLPLPGPRVVVDEPWMEGFFFKENLTLPTAIRAMATPVALFRSAPGGIPDMTPVVVRRRLPRESPAWDVLRSPRPLWERMRKALAKGHNVAVWVERKGYGFLLCEVCGWRARCPKDGASLVVFHHPTLRLVCPRCDAHHPVPVRCPSCGGETLRERGRGLEYVAETFKHMFPEARILTLAGSSVASSRRRLLYLFEKGGADILVGTWSARAGFVHPATRILVVWYPETFLRSREEEHKLALRLSWLSWMREEGRILLTLREDLPLFRALKEGKLRPYFARTWQ